MKRKVLILAAVSVLTAVGLLAAGTPASSAAAKRPVFYWINHGSASDPFWVGASKGALQAGRDLGVTVKTSFLNGDVAAQKEAVLSAIAAHATGIAVSSPKDGALVAEIKKAKAAGIPVVMFNSDDPTTGRDAYVGANLMLAGKTWAEYLVNNKLVKSGDFVWMPVEAPGATYQTEEESGIKSVFAPLNITYEVFNATGDPAQSLQNMTTYVISNKAKINAIIGMGDLVMGNIQKVFTSAGVKAGSIPVVGWGNTGATAKAVVAGYVTAGLWQYPDSQGYLPISLLMEAHDGIAIGYDVTTTALYTKANAAKFVKLTK